MDYAKLNQEKLLLLDGGFSNVLNKYCSFDVHQEGLWTAKALLHEEDAIVKAHMEYLDAGVDIIETSSYQASLPGFKECLDLDQEEGEKLIRKSAQLTKQAVDLFMKKNQNNQKTVPLIAGSVGPYGAYLRDGSEYVGTYAENISNEQLAEFHLPRLQYLIDEGVDLLSIETNPSMKEVEVILELLRLHFPNVQAWTTFSLRTNEKASQNSKPVVHPLISASGDSLTTAFETLTTKYSDQLWGFGVNCVPPEAIKPMLTEINSIRQKLSTRTKPKLVVYPNSGQKWTAGTGWAHENIPTIGSYVEEWSSLGANVIGGCCQVGPEEIKSIRPIIDKWNAKLEQ